MIIKQILKYACAAALATSSLFAAAQTPNWHVAKHFDVGGEGGWDYVTVDHASHRIFVTRSKHTQVIDEQTGKLLGDIPGQMSSHGVALVPALNRGFITDGGGQGAIVIFDLKTYAILGKLTALPDADGIIYDEAQHKILAVTGDSMALLTVSPDVDPVNGKLDAPIMLGGKPEFLASDGTGKVYVNIEDKDVVAVVDLHSRQVTARWPVAPGGQPVGMAIDTTHHRLLIGCRKPQMMVSMSTADGKILGSVPIGVGVDATAYDNGQAFASCRDGSLTVAGDVNGVFTTQQTFKTAIGSRTMGLDATGHSLWLPAADFDAPATAGGRPAMKAGSFRVIEVDSK